MHILAYCIEDRTSRVLISLTHQHLLLVYICCQVNPQTFHLDIEIWQRVAIAWLWNKRSHYPILDANSLGRALGILWVHPLRVWWIHHERSQDRVNTYRGSCGLHQSSIPIPWKSQCWRNGLGELPWAVFFFFYFTVRFIDQVRVDMIDNVSKLRVLLTCRLLGISDHWYKASTSFDLHRYKVIVDSNNLTESGTGVRVCSKELRYQDIPTQCA